MKRTIIDIDNKMICLDTTNPISIVKMTDEDSLYFVKRFAVIAKRELIRATKEKNEIRKSIDNTIANIDKVK